MYDRFTQKENILGGVQTGKVFMKKYIAKMQK